MDLLKLEQLQAKRKVAELQLLLQRERYFKFEVEFQVLPVGKLTFWMTVLCSTQTQMLRNLCGMIRRENWRHILVRLNPNATLWHSRWREKLTKQSSSNPSERWKHSKRTKTWTGRTPPIFNTLSQLLHPSVGIQSWRNRDERATIGCQWRDKKHYVVVQAWRDPRIPGNPMWWSRTRKKNSLHDSE